LKLLVQLREKIDKGAFNEKRDMEILERIYGPENDGDDTLKSVYARCAATEGSSEEERKAGAYPTPEECKRVFLNEIDREMHQLRLNSKRSKWVEFGQSKLEIHQRMVPDSPGLDRLLRYEASLERSFDRTLGQLERMQRLRRGQPVAPRIDVNIAS
jgi:hypothetical protein